MSTKIELQSLVSFWGLHSEYLPELKRFAAPSATEDDQNQVRVVALSALGEYARSTKDLDVIRLLVGIFDDVAKTNICATWRSTP